MSVGRSRDCANEFAPTGGRSRPTRGVLVALRLRCPLERRFLLGSHRKTPTLILILVAFGLLTSYAMWQVGYIGIFTSSLINWGTVQVFGDLVVASVLIMVWMVRTLVNIISSTPRVFVSGCGKARFAGNSGAIAKKCNAAAAAHEQLDVEIILTRVLSDARARGLNAWPFVLVTLLAGSFGVLFYLLRRGVDAPAVQAT